MLHALAQIDDDHSSFEIAGAVDILQAIRWTVAAWNEVVEITIRNCFAKSFGRR